MRRIKLISRPDNKYQREGIDHDPVEPFAWATIPGRRDPVDVMSYPISAKGDGLEINHSRATVMVRLRIDDPTSLVEMPLKSVACFNKNRYYTCTS